MKLRITLPRLADLRADSLLAFEVLDKQRRIARRGDGVLGSLPKIAECELVLNALDCVLLPSRLPKLTGARLGAALPSLAEERIVADIENAHVCATAREEGKDATLAVVDRSLLRRALDLFKRAGIRVVSATPAPLALAVRPGYWRVRLFPDGTGAARLGSRHGIGFTTDGIAAPVELLLALRQTAERPQGIDVEGHCDESAWGDALGVPVRGAAPPEFAPAVVLELLRYQFAPVMTLDKGWRPTLVLAAVFVIFFVSGLNLHAWMLRSEEKAVRARMDALVKESFPSIAVVLDPVEQMRRQIVELRPGSDPSSLLSLLPVVARLAPPDSVKSLEYRGGTLALGLRFGADRLEAERNRLLAEFSREGLLATASADGLQLTRKAAP